MIWAKSDGGTCMDGGTGQAASGQTFSCLPTIPFGGDCYGASAYHFLQDDIAMRNCAVFGSVHGDPYSLVPLDCGCRE